MSERRSDYYIPTKGKKMVPTTLEKWARWLEKADRHVGITQVGDVFVSTICIGLDHSGGFGPPQLFETMAFEGDDVRMELDGYTQRYATWAEAEAGHAATVELVKASRSQADELLQETIKAMPDD